MTELRDARLQKALESAPDGEVRPGLATREAVRDFAHRAVAPAAAEPWWRKLWPAMGDNRMPWNAAFATIALATLVTLLWRDEEIPGAKGDRAADRPSVAQGPAQAPASVAVPTAAPAPPPAPAAKPEAPAPAPELARRPSSPQAQGSATSGEPSKKTMPQESSRERKPEGAADALRDRQDNALSKSLPAPAPAPAPVEGPRPPPAVRSESLESRAAGTAAAPMAAPALRAAPRSTTATATSVAQPPPWNQMRLMVQGRTLDVSREQGQRLADQFEALLRTAAAAEPLVDPVGTRIELRQDGEVVLTYEVAGSQVRVVRPGGAPAMAMASRPDPAQLRAALAEADRLLGPR